MKQEPLSCQSLHEEYVSKLITYSYADDVNIAYFVRQRHEGNFQQEYDNVSAGLSHAFYCHAFLFKYIYITVAYIILYVK